MKKDEFSSGRAQALRARTLGTTATPTALAAITRSAAVTAGNSVAPRLEPVHSFDTATYLSKLGNPPQYRISQQQVDTLRQQGMQHGVIGFDDGYLPAFTHGLDRNVWLQDANLPALPITAIPSGFRADLPVQNQALYALIKSDQGKPVDQRKFKTLQDVVNQALNGGQSFRSLGISESACYQNRGAVLRKPV